MSEEKVKVFEIAILGRALWELHSLNNEGNVGNVVEPRSVKIIDPNTGKAVTTDGISGEMLKHIHAEMMWILDNKNNLCDACKIQHPERFNYVIKTNSRVKNSINRPGDAISQALNTCDICDIHGFMITEKVTVSRKSTVEFGWALGIPEVYRDIHLHARHSTQTQAIEEVLEPGQWNEHKCSVKGCDTDPNESRLLKINGKWYCEAHAPTAQMIYHRPTRTGEYAIVTVFQPWRICLNEAKQDVYSYECGDNKGGSSRRLERYKLALRAYQLMFLRPKGAMTTTRLPHTVNFKGVIVYSTEPIPVPVISPLKDKYKEEIKAIAQSFKNGDNEPIKVVEFNSLSEFVKKLNNLLNAEPYEMNFNPK
ncbi:DevR family CRISPR-associated autoregulator [Thermococcus sp.]|uniref:DevR family CRISPR-associated autoregulator n=1 Tax=Thermococcus sp. TaxID=35749 RepID=UPI002623BCA5|nr:DevR family CRISPR-associated autoregulator [Thermococcus sp.]